MVATLGKWTHEQHQNISTFLCPWHNIFFVLFLLNTSAGSLVLDKVPTESALYQTNQNRLIGKDDFPRSGWLDGFSQVGK